MDKLIQKVPILNLEKTYNKESMFVLDFEEKIELYMKQYYPDIDKWTWKRDQVSHSINIYET